MNGFIVIDKPEGLTSHDVVARVRKIFGTRQVGHGGTLDPLATGVLPVAVGKATRMLEYLLHDSKSYIATMQFGYTSDTFDNTGDVMKTEQEIELQEDEFRAVVQSIQGKHDQLPPMFSAKKVKGKKLYDYAREGIELERKSVPIEIFKAEVLQYSKKEATILLHVSKGTYVRTIVHDLGQDIGCGAVMTALQRIQSGVFTIDDAISMDELALMDEQSRLNTCLPLHMPLETVLRIDVDEESALRLRQGQRIQTKHTDIQLVSVFDDRGCFIGPGRVSENTLKMIKVVG